MPTQCDITTERESALLAPYAMHSADSAGRRYPEPLHNYRGPYQRDRDRIVHSGAFRRLSHKTQVFTGEMGDYHRTRLTHTLEMASIARTIARALRLNEDLVEALALAHDIGHPPFGHSGEDVLDECLAEHGGFNHNAQALRIFEVVEKRYVGFSGLNLSWEVLDGQTHRAEKGVPLPRPLSLAEEAGERSNVAHQSTEEKRRLSPLLEVQIVDAADSIAYDAHDADDALEIGLLTIDQLLDVPLWREARQRVEQRSPEPVDRTHRRAVVHELIDWQVGDLLIEVDATLRREGIHSLADVRRSPLIARHSPSVAEKKRELETFLFDHVYRHPNVLAKRREAQQSLREMFDLFLRNPTLLPTKFRQIASVDGSARAVGDYLAGMTDRYAFDEHRRLLGTSST